MATAAPPGESRERDEIEDLSRTFSDAGFDLQLSKEGTSWIAALVRHETLIPALAQHATGPTAVEATRGAWRLYRSVPSLNSLDPAPISSSELLVRWVEEFAARQRHVDARNARALDSLATYLVDATRLGTENTREVERLAPAFRAGTFPRLETQRLLVQHRSAGDEAHSAVLNALVRTELETGD
jgi:hypothetical protein